MKKIYWVFFLFIVILIPSIFYITKTNQDSFSAEKYFDLFSFNDNNEDHERIYIKYIKESDYLLIASKKAWEHRVINNINLFINAFNLIRDKIDTDFSLTIETGDYSFNASNLACSYRNVKGKYQIPDFSFYGWPECGFEDYDETCKEIEEAGKKPYIYDKIFWIGNTETNKVRERLVEKGLYNEKFEFIGMNWIRPTSKKDKLERQKATKYVSLPDHAQYKYLIDAPGTGYSARIKLLMFSNRPLFIIERNDVEYFMKDLKPFVHYIPVRYDLSDLDEKYRWAEENYEEAQKIAQNALEYAKNNLKTKDAVLKYSEVLSKYIDDYKKQQEIKKLKNTTQ